MEQPGIPQDENLNRTMGAGRNDEQVIPVIQEFISVEKEMVETGKVYITKKVTEKDATVNIPLTREGYTVEHRAVKSKVHDKPPAVRYEGDNIIIPVVQEILVIEKKYEVIEEVHVIKTLTEVPHMEQVPLLKEEVVVERRAAGDNV